jgi:3-oxoadipate enol-lactonase
MSDGLLLLHAWPLDAGMWEPQLTSAPVGLQIAAPNHPGFGDSAPAGDVMTMAAAADRALAALDDVGIERAVVCGLSIGGYIAFELWRRARERIAGLVLANTRAVADTPEAAGGRRALAERLLAEGNFLADDPPGLLAPDAPEELRQRVQAMIAAQPAEAIAAAALGMAERPDSTPDLAGIDVPTLVVTATADQLIAPDVSAAMAARIPQARLETIDGVGHLSNLEAPEAFGRLLWEHVAACGVQ